MRGRRQKGRGKVKSGYSPRGVVWLQRGTGRNDSDNAGAAIRPVAWGASSVPGMGLIIGLLLLWLVLTVFGFVVKGLFWLAIIGIVLLLATVAYGFVKGLFKSASR